MKKVVVMLFVLLMGCNVNPSEFGKGEAKAFASKVTYTKDIRTGLCFAMVASRETGSTDQTGFGMTAVPCKAVEKYLK